MESKYQVTYNKSKYGWFANVDYYEFPNGIRKLRREKIGENKGLNLLGICEEVRYRLRCLEENIEYKR